MQNIKGFKLALKSICTCCGDSSGDIYKWTTRLVFFLLSQLGQPEVARCPASASLSCPSGCVAGLRAARCPLGRSCCSVSSWFFLGGGFISFSFSNVEAARDATRCEITHVGLFSLLLWAEGGRGGGSSRDHVASLPEPFTRCRSCCSRRRWRPRELR